MEKICGYKGLDGKFYEKEKECYQADLRFKILDLRATLDRFERDFDREFFERYERLSIYSSRQMSKEYSKEIALRVVAELVLRNSDKFVEIIQNREKLKTQLDLLVKEEQYLDKWWVKFKWW